MLPCLSSWWFAAYCMSWYTIVCMMYNFQEYSSGTTGVHRSHASDTCYDHIHEPCPVFQSFTYMFCLYWVLRTSRSWCSRLHCVILQASSHQPIAMATIVSAVWPAQVATWCTQAWCRHSNSCYGKEHHKLRAGPHVRSKISKVWHIRTLLRKSLYARLQHAAYL